VTVIPDLFQLTLVHNTGAAFGVGRAWSIPFFVIASLVALGVVGYLFHRLDESEKGSLWGLVLILSGAVGNLVDRIRFGYVVDFLDLFVGTRHWPAFNVADAAITVGAILFALDLLRSKKKEA
jgi:signal peptidase II